MRDPTSFHFLALMSAHHRRSNCSAPVAFDQVDGCGFQPLQPAEIKMAAPAKKQSKRRLRTSIAGLYTTAGRLLIARASRKLDYRFLLRDACLNRIMRPL